MIGTTSRPLTDGYEAKVARLYDEKQEDFNFKLGQQTGLIHHHFGMGRPDRAKLSGLPQNQINEILHELENAQVDYIIKALGVVKPTDRIFDGGSGRGGTALILHGAFGCYYDGATISEYQCEFSRRLARARGVADKVSFHLMNMRSTTFPSHHFQQVITNETTMYVADLMELYREFSRILQPNGRYVTMTWSIDDSHPNPRRYTDPIDEHYLCRMHTRSEYLTALVANRLIPYVVTDLNAEALPYWELRSLSESRTGVERLFIEGYRAGAIKYMLIGAQHLPAPGHSAQLS